MDHQAIVDRVKELIQPLLVSRKIELVEMICRYEARGVVLRFLVDTARGITLGELGSLNQAIGALMEEHDVIPERYLLEVSSPGLDRPLKTSFDFERLIGRRVKVSTTTPVDSRWEHVGELLNANDEAIVLKNDSGEKVRILLLQVARAVQDVQF